MGIVGNIWEQKTSLQLLDMDMGGNSILGTSNENVGIINMFWALDIDLSDLTMVKGGN